MANSIISNESIVEQNTVWALLIGIAVVGSNSLLLSPILTSVASGLDATVVEVARAGAAYGGATAIAALAFSRWIDRLGTRLVLIIGFVVLGIALFASAASTGWKMLATAQGLAGLAAGLILPATYSHAIASAPEGQGAQTLGKVLNGWAISLVAGVPVSALVAGAFGWRTSYLVLGAVCAGVATVLWRFGSRTASAQATDTSILPALRTPGVPPLLAICFAFMTAFYGVYAYLGDHLQRGLGASTGLASAAVLAYGIGFAVAGRADPLVDRLGARRVFPFCLAALALLYFSMFLANDSVPMLLGLASVGVLPITLE